MNRRLFAPLVIALVTIACIGAVGCSSDTTDKAGDAVESAKDDVATRADETQARVAAEELRARIKANDTADADGVRSVSALNESAEDLVGDPTVTGIDDADGDGLDDDGKVQIDIDQSSACLTLPDTGENTTVEGGAC